ncbi:MAG TPA: hypothetical protein PK961_11535 [bacterium]|nr:hypothetical protein [bacterium]
MACFLAVTAGIAMQVPPIAVFKRALIATGSFAMAAFLGGLIYEKMWRR